MTQACSSQAKVLLKSQVFEYYVDCPMTRPIWWHPDAMPAVCLMEGGLDLEDVRTGSSGDMTRPTGARHLHNFGMSTEDVIFKYSHYVEAGGGEGMHAAEHEERRWRACDPTAPPIGPAGWHSAVRPATDLIRPDNARGFAEAPESRRGVSREFALLRERPELAARAYWKGHGEKENTFVGSGLGEYDYTGRLAAARGADKEW